MPLNKSKRKPLDECNGRYAWEPKHAKKVVEKRREAARAKMRAAKQQEEHEQPEENNSDPADEMSINKNDQQDDVACKVLGSGDESASVLIKANLNIKDGLSKRRNKGDIQKRRSIDKKTVDAKKLQQVFECGKYTLALDLRNLSQLLYP